MKFDEFLSKLQILEKNNPSQFKKYLDELKIKQPNIYEKVVNIMDGTHEVIPTEEEPLDLNITSAAKKQSNNNMIIIAVIAVIIIIVGAAAFLLLQ